MSSKEPAWDCAIFPDEVVTSHGPIEADKENIRQEPYSLPQGFMWDTLDLGSAEVVSRFTLGSEYGHSNCWSFILCNTLRKKPENIKKKIVTPILKILSLSAEGVVHVIKWELCWGRWQHVQIRLFSKLSEMVSVRLACPRARRSLSPSALPLHLSCPPQGSASARLATAVALWGESVLKQEAGGLHQRHSRRHTHLRHVSPPALPPDHPPTSLWGRFTAPPFFPFAPLQSEEDGGDQLLVCAQEAAFEARRSGAHQRDHTEGEPRGDISGSLHSRSGSAQTCVYVQVSYTTHTHTSGNNSRHYAALHSSCLLFVEVLAPFSEPQEACRSEILPPE